MEKICLTCKCVFIKKPSDSKKYWMIKKYCSIRCSGTLIKKGNQIGVNTQFKPGFIGNKNLNWRGGKNIGKNGYVRVLIPGTGNYALEHRLVMEKMLGRKLEKREVVHHKNHNRQDNREENLELMIKKDHDRMETKDRWDNNPRSFGRVLHGRLRD